MNTNEERLTLENAELRRKLKAAGPKSVAAKMKGGNVPSARKAALEALSAAQSAERERDGVIGEHGARPDRGAK